MNTINKQNRRRLLLRALATVGVGFALCGMSVAQPEQVGTVAGGYKIQQSVEIGERVTSVSGSSAMYDTLQNLQQGPRLLDHTFYMRSLNHASRLVDELLFSSYGYGGDPHAGSRLRMSRNRWYDLKADFRSDKNYWDYNLMDQPFNTPGGTYLWDQSVHRESTRRNTGGFNLTLMPQSKLTWRLGYSANDNSGFAYTTLHQSGDYQLLQNVRTRQDEWRLGADFTVAPRTLFRFDETYDHNRQTSTWSDPNVASRSANVAASGGTTNTTGVFDPGLFYDPNYNQPCKNLLVNGIVQVANCSNVLSSYERESPTTTKIPTSQLSFTSNYFTRLDVTASASYSSANSYVNYNDLSQLYYSSSRVKAQQLSGAEKIRQTTASADFGATFDIGDNWSVSDEVRFLRWNIPAAAALTTTTCFPNGTVTSPDTFISAGVGSPTSANTCAGLSTRGTAYAGTSTTADVSTDAIVRFLGERSLYNIATLNWDPSRRLSLHTGYRFGNRILATESLDTITATTYADYGTNVNRVAGTKVTITPSAGVASDSKSLNEHVMLLGTELRPTSGWRVIADYNLLYATNSFAAIVPRHQQKVKLHSTYTLGRFGSVTGTFNLASGRNDTVANDNGTPDFPAGVTSPRHTDDMRYYSLGYSAKPARWVTMNLGWTYQQVYSNSGTCMPLTSGVVPSGGTVTSTTPNGYAGCVFSGATSNNELPSILKYQQNTNTGYFKVVVKPTRALTLTGGYDLSANSGDNQWLRADTGAKLQVPVDATLLNVVTSNPIGFATGPNPRVPFGSLNTVWHRPMAGIEYAVNRQITLKGIFNNYQYHEKSPRGVLLVPRDFSANTGTLSVKYLF